MSASRLSARITRTFALMRQSVRSFRVGAGPRDIGRDANGDEAFDRITIQPGKMSGQPCIREHRFTVAHLLALVGAGWTLPEIQADFPFIEAADICQATAYASISVREYRLPISQSE